MWLELVAAVLIVLQSIAILLLWRQGYRLKQGFAAKSGVVPELLIVNALNKIDHRLSALETRAQHKAASVSRPSTEVVATQMTATRSASLHSSANNYELAQQLAREGCDLEQLIARCGLSRNEAELVLRLYTKRA